MNKSSTQKVLNKKVTADFMVDSKKIPGKLRNTGFQKFFVNTMVQTNLHK